MSVATRTDVAYITTAQADGQRNPSNFAQYLRDKWSQDIDGPSSIDLSMYAGSPNETVALSNPSNPENAINQLLNDYTVSNLLSTYDGVVVLDSRKFGETAGRVDEIGCAGDDNAVAYVTTEGNELHAAHEVGHLYNARHEDCENWGWAEYTIMGSYSYQTCNNNNLQWTPKGRFSDCTQSEIESYIQSNL